MLQASLAPATRVAYAKPWDLYDDFHSAYYGMDYTLPLSEANIMFFISLKKS